MKRSFALVFALGVMPSTSAPLEVPGATVVNLQRAFQAEVQAAEAFNAFARRAEQEGFRRAARLLRAVALGEQAHARSHGEVLRALGAEPRAPRAEVELRGTRENLAAAIAREDFERAVLYPTLLGDARELGDPTPVRTFSVAMLVERAHLELLRTALTELSAGGAADRLCVKRSSGHVVRCGAGAPEGAACCPAEDAALEPVE